MFIEPEQIRAARAMLNWSQTDLAEAAGVSKDTVKNYESGNNRPNTNTLVSLETALVTAGIEFLSGGGIQPAREKIKILHGHEGMRSLMDMVYQACRDGNANNIIVANVRQTMYSHWLSDYASIHRERMTNLNIKEPLKFLIKKDHIKLAKQYNYVNYKVVEDHYFGDIGLYCFSECVAMINFEDNNCVITLIENGTLKKTMEKLLAMIWENAKPFEAERD